MITNKNIAYYLTAIGVFALLKFSYTNSDTNDLNFLLSPTNQIVGLLTGSQSVFIQDSGYFYGQLNILIDKSCSGFNFWLICFLMLSFLTLKYFKNKASKISALSFSLIGAYIFTILVNSSRIYTSIIIQSKTLSFTSHSIVHEIIGIVTNLTFLILIYLTVEKILIKLNTNAEFA